MAVLATDGSETATMQMQMQERLGYRSTVFPGNVEVTRTGLDRLYMKYLLRVGPGEGNQGTKPKRGWVKWDEKELRSKWEETGV